MKAARPWTEEVVYVDCPYCGDCNDLGCGVVWNDTDEVMCEHCGKDFALTNKDDTEGGDK